MSDFMTLAWAGLSLGAVYAIVAMGFNVVIASSGLFNFAAPQFVVLGAFIGLELFDESSTLPTVLGAIGVAILVGTVLGYLEERIAVRPLLGANRDSHSVLITTIGFAVFLEGTAFAIWGSQSLPVQAPYVKDIIELLGGRVQIGDLLLIGIAIVLGLALYIASRFSRWGISGRATTSDYQAAQLRGINASRIRTNGFVISAVILTVVGILIGSKMQASYSMGMELVLIAFVAFVLGGSGSYFGALIGGLVLGVFQIMVSRFAGNDFQLIAVFVLLLGVLLLKPTGILGSRSERNV